MSIEQLAIDALRDSMPHVPTRMIRQIQKALQGMERKYGDTPAKLTPLPFPRRKIKTKYGQITIVDAEDYDFLMQFGAKHKKKKRRKPCRSKT